jgi:hypothetical protein
VPSRFSDIVQGYTSLASTLVGRWNVLASRSAAKLDAGTYNAASATEDVVAGAVLSTEAAGLYAVEGFKTLAACLGQEGEGSVVESEPFAAPLGAHLELACAPVKGPGLLRLPMSTVSIAAVQAATGRAHPTLRSAVSTRPTFTLPPNQGDFLLCVDTTACQGGTYVATVNATTEAGGTTQIPIWIVVP